MKDKEKDIEEFRDMIVYFCKNDIKPSDVSSFIWKHHRDESFSEETKKLHDLVMGNNGCDELMFRLEVIDERTIKVA